MHLLWDVTTIKGDLPSSPLDSKRGRCLLAVAGMINSVRALPAAAAVNLRSRSRRNSAHIPQIQRAAMTLLWILLYWTDQVFKTGVSCQGYYSYAHLNSRMCSFIYLPGFYWKCGVAYMWVTLVPPPLAIKAATLAFLPAAVNVSGLFSQYPH